MLGIELGSLIWRIEGFIAQRYICVWATRRLNYKWWLQVPLPQSRELGF